MSFSVAFNSFAVDDNLGINIAIPISFWRIFLDYRVVYINRRNDRWALVIQKLRHLVNYSFILVLIGTWLTHSQSFTFKKMLFSCKLHHHLAIQHSCAWWCLVIIEVLNRATRWLLWYPLPQLLVLLHDYCFVILDILQHVFFVWHALLTAVLSIFQRCSLVDWDLRHVCRLHLIGSY